MDNCGECGIDSTFYFVISSEANKVSGYEIFYFHA